MYNNLSKNFLTETFIQSGWLGDFSQSTSYA